MNIEQIKHKKYISTKEFTLLYGFSSEWQKNRRGRIHNSLPYFQEDYGCKILYNVRDVDIWFENNTTKR